ncbi:MAG: hypothetical protein ACWA5L_09155 [bacterium]
MKHAHKIVLTGLLGVSALMTQSAVADSDAQLAATYENAKPEHTGLRPSTRAEYATCWMAWNRLGKIIIAADGDITSVHPDWTTATADQHFQHWWKVAEGAYGKERHDQLISKAQELSDYFHDTTKTNEWLGWAGTCYIPMEKRVAFQKPRPLEKFIKAAQIKPEQQPTPSPAPSAAPARPAPGTTQWVYGKAVGSNFTCRDYYYQTDAKAKADAKQTCRQKGGAPGDYPIITNSGFDAYKANADQCYEAVAKVECSF